MFVLFSVGVALDASAQDSYVVQRLRGPIEVDGRVDEPAWENVAPLPMTMMTPTFRGTPSVRSDVRMAFDDDNLYLAGRMYDHPDSILATSYKRDLLQPNIDYFGIFIDSFNDNENGFGFYTTPTGLRLDFSIADDAQSNVTGQEPANESWNTFWDAEVTRDGAGWYAEIRIPFSSLRFESVGGTTEMGVIVQRRSGKRNEQYTYPAINPTYGSWSWAKPSIAQTVTFENIYSSRPVYITPYALSGLDQRFELNGSQTEYRRIDDPTVDLGLDLKYGLTNNLVMDLTVNTDFAQVEADDQQVNLTRLPLFFPEKRRFFLERESMFEFSLGGRNRLFYSRRIGLHEGQIVPIIAGVKVAGRVAGWDVGFLDMHTAEAAGLPSENHGVFRMRTRTFNPYSYSGGVLTTRLGLDGTYNVAFGTDHTVRVFGDDYLSLVLAQTYDHVYDNRLLDFDAMRTIGTWERRTFAGLGYRFRYSRSGERYRPDLGFETRENYYYTGARAGWGWLLGEASLLQGHRVELSYSGFWRNEDHTVETVSVGPTWEAATKSGWILQAGWNASYEDLRAPLVIGDVAVPTGSYWFQEVEATLEAPGTRKLWGEATLNTGSFYDGRRISAAVNPIWTLSRLFELQAYYEANWVALADGQTFTAHVSRVRGQATFNTEWALSTFVQYNSAIDAVLTNIRLRFNPREGNDFYLVYNEGMNTDRYRLVPTLPFTSARTLLAKYTYTFRH